MPSGEAPPLLAPARPLIDASKACRVLVLDRLGTPRFQMCFYGLHAAELNLIVDYGKKGPPEYPTSGSAVIHHAMRRRGLDPGQYICTPFHIQDMPQISGPRVKREYHRA